MSRALLHSFVLLTALGFSTAVYAQESGFPTEEEETVPEANNPAEEEWNVREGGMIIPEKQQLLPADKNSDNPVATQPGTSRSQTPPRIENNNSRTGEREALTRTDSEDESVLSFNFLYYLIQKFKFDTVE